MDKKTAAPQQDVVPVQDVEPAKVVADVAPSATAEAKTPKTNEEAPNVTEDAPAEHVTGQDAETEMMKKQSKSPVIIIAVFVALLLIGLGYAAVLVGDGDAEPIQPAVTPVEQPAAAPVEQSEAALPLDAPAAEEEAAALDALLEELESIEESTDADISDESLNFQ